MAEVTRVTQAGTVLIMDAGPSIRASQMGTVLVATGVRGEPPAVDPAQSTASVPVNGEVGTPTAITVQAKDNTGANWPSGGDAVVVSVTGANTVTPTVTDVGDGTYTASYTPTAAGADSVAITLNGTAISGSPYASTVGAAPVSAAVSGSAGIYIGIGIRL